MRANSAEFDYITYILDTHRIYTGHGRGTRKIGDRVDEEAKENSQVYAICSHDWRFGKFQASYVEARNN